MKDKNKFYVYMEGYSSHRNGTKRLFVKREEWPSRMAYLWSKFAFRLWDRFFIGRETFPDEETFTFGRIGDWLMDQGIHHGPIKIFYYSDVIEYN